MRILTTLPQENVAKVGAAAQAIEATGYTGVSTQENKHEPFLSLAVAGEEPTIADVSMSGYLCFPKHEAGYDLAVSHPAIGAWLSRLSAAPGWQAPYDLLPGKRLHCYVS